MSSARQDTAVGPWQRTALFPEPRPQSLREALRTLAAAIPDQIAIREGDRTLTYAELSRMTDAVAGAVSEAGGAPVTVIVGHGIDALLMVFGVIASGRIMVPLDAKDPIERLALVHREAGATVTFTDRAHVAVAEAAMPRGAIVVLEDALTSMPTPSSLRDPDPYEIAVVLFTSGSTGTPKGVVRDHVALLRHAMSATYSNGIVPGDQIAFTGSFAFVGAYSRSLGALLGGATICVHDYRTDSLRSFPEWVVANRIAVIQMVPSVLRALTDAASGTGAPRMDCVRLITLSGETLYGRDVARARPLFGKDTVFRNRLGATESASIASWDVTVQDDLAADDPVPIGYVEPWTELHIVDDDGQQVPIGIAGLADVISDHASRGYWRDPELTAQKFWDLPEGRRGFHTSDRVRVRPDGVLEHITRTDDRVKIRAAMVSPGEVEHALVRLDGVMHAAVVPAPTRDGGTRLVAYVVPEVGATPSAWQLRRDLAVGMPTTMVPSAIVLLDALPRSPRGKVDRSKLPSPPDVARRVYRAPVGREAVLADLIGSVLAVEQVGLDDDFFDLGGDSLAAIELMAAIDDQFGIDLPPSTLLAAPTPASLTPLLNHRRPRGSSTAVALREGRGTPFFCLAGGGSPATSLRALAHALPNNLPVYGIQARGLEERGRPDRSVEACARRYLADVRAIQPAGPYLLGGHSFGGLVAFEMASRLEAVGETVTLLVILDTPAPVPRTAARYPAPAPATRAHSVSEMTRQLAISVAGRAQREAELATAGLVVRRLRQYRVFNLLSSRLTRRYRPHSTFGGPVLVARATIPDPDLPRGALPASAWTEFARGPFTTVEIPGTHVGIMRRPHVTTLAHALGQAIADHSPRS